MWSTSTRSSPSRPGLSSTERGIVLREETGLGAPRPIARIRRATCSLALVRRGVRPSAAVPSPTRVQVQTGLAGTASVPSGPSFDQAGWELGGSGKARLCPLPEDAEGGDAVR